MAYDIFSEFYDILTENAEYEKRADYFCRLLSLCGQSGGILLDLACGTGSMSLELAKRGFEVIGVDSSVGMLSRAQAKSLESGQKILLLCQEMQSIDLYGTVDCCVCALDSLNHLPGAQEVKKTFGRVSLFMNRGGAFVFDVNTQYKHREILADNAFVYDCGDIFCAWQNDYNESDGSVDIRLDFFARDDEGEGWLRSCEQFTERAYELESIKEWLEEAGFEVVGIFDDMTENAVAADSQRAVFAAIKK